MNPRSINRFPLVGLILLSLSLTTSARDNASILQKYSPPAIDWYNIAQYNRVLQCGNVEMNIVNCGWFGNHGYNLNSEHWHYPEFPGIWAPACDFPRGSDTQYLAFAPLWVGALVQLAGSEVPRVSTGLNGWETTTYELRPGEWGGLPVEEHGILERSNIPGKTDPWGGNVYSPDALAPQEYLAGYTDTLTQQYWVGIDPADGPHFPLGVKVRQKAMVWDVNGFDDFVIFEYTVINMGSQDLKNLYLGIYVDSDVGIPWEDNNGSDDVSGIVQNVGGSVWNLLYTADNDGRASWDTSGNDFTVPSVAGVYLLDAPGNPQYCSYNWWESSNDPEYDMGPSWVDDNAPGNWTATYGTPMGDAKKYFLMKNGEKDYDQPYVANWGYVQSHPQEFTDPFTGATTTHAWKQETSPVAWDIANGGDTRYLVSWGPLGYNIALPGQTPETYLYPGDSLSFTIAYVCGEGFHDPQNPQGNVTTGPINPALYRYEDLIYNATKAKFLVDHNYQILPPYTPQNLHVTAAPDTALWLAWDAYPLPPTTYINLFRRNEGGQYGPNPLNPQPLQGTTYADETVILGQRYYYKALAVRYDTLCSYFCPEIAFTAGAPFATPGLQAASGGNGHTYLTWEVNPAPDVNHYNIYRADSIGIMQYLVSVSESALAYADYDVMNGFEYFYTLAAVDDDNIVGVYSDTVSATPMGYFDALLVLRETATYPMLEWSQDSVETYYQLLFSEVCQDLGWGEPDFLTLAPSADFPDLETLSPYLRVWYVHDNHGPMPSPDYQMLKAQILENYLAYGGNLIVSGRNIFNGAFYRGTSPWMPYQWSLVGSGPSTGGILRNYFKLDSVYSANPLLVPPPIPDFEGASPVNPWYPTLTLDPLKIEQFNANPMGWDYLPAVHGMKPTDEGEALYTFESHWPDTSTLQGETVGVRYLSDLYSTTILTFPLYAMQPYTAVKQLVYQILDSLPPNEVEPSNQRRLIPEIYSLAQNYPNPFNPTTTIRFGLPTPAHVLVTIYNLLGQEIAKLTDSYYPAGYHVLLWRADDLPSGLYFYRLQTGGFNSVRKMLLVK